MPKISLGIKKTLWIGVCLAVLGITSYGSGRPENRDNILVLTWAMFVLAFPSSFLFVLVYARLGRMMPDKPALAGYVTFFVTWLGFFFLGYLQWFVLVPSLIRRFRTRNV
jgi:hypothetical protein